MSLKPRAAVCRAVVRLRSDLNVYSAQHKDSAAARVFLGQTSFWLLCSIKMCCDQLRGSGDLHNNPIYDCLHSFNFLFFIILFFGKRAMLFVIFRFNVFFSVLTAINEKKNIVVYRNTLSHLLIIRAGCVK